MDNKIKYKEIKCIQCEDLTIASQRVIEDWNAYNRTKRSIKDIIIWESLYLLEELLLKKLLKARSK